MNFNIISLFQETFQAITNSGITRRALENKIYQLNFYNPRDFTKDIHKTVDDKPYGGGAGMVMMYQPIKDALQKIPNKGKVIYMSPQGKTLNHQKIMEFKGCKNLTILCGRYEGVDQRVIDNLVDEEISIGDYVLSGGEIPTMVLIDAVVRQLDGALGDKNSALQDSFVDDLLDYPHYTRPEIVDNLKVPEVLLSGNHQEIAQWRKKKSLQQTKNRRSDLLKNKNIKGHL